MKIKSLVSILGSIVLMAILANGFAAPASFDCGYSCGKFGNDWQSPEDQANCLAACKSCQYQEDGNQYWCSNDAMPDCICIK